MNDEITVSRKELECLRRSLKEALDYIESLGIREKSSPGLTRKELKQQRINHFKKKLQ